MHRTLGSLLFTLLVICVCFAGDVDNAYSQLPAPTCVPTSSTLVNVAAASSNGMVSAASINSNFPASAVIDGDTRGLNWGSGGGWNDATQGYYPDDIQVDFAVTRFLQRIDIFTIQDNIRNPVCPTADLRFNYYGIVDFDVYYIDTSGVPQLVQSIRGNNLVWRQVVLPSVVSAKGVLVRVLKGKSAAPSDYSRIAEIEAWATPITMTLSNPFVSKNDNFMLDGVGYSVFYSSPIFHAFATNNLGAAKWNRERTAIEGFFGRFSGTSDGENDPPCAWNKDPSLWDSRCSTDAIGYYWKRDICTSSTGEPCQDNDLWNASPGRANLDVYPSHTKTPIWPRLNAWGTEGFQWIIDHNKINSVMPNPPLTGKETQCNPNNPRSLATGAANAKVVQVRMPDNSIRWFMAFNSMTHVENNGPTDNWRIMWATSTDGANWTILPEILFRSRVEAQSCGFGFLVTDMFVEDGYFYMLFADVGESYGYMVRTRIEPSYQWGMDKDRWFLAATPLSSSRQYTWKPIATGPQLDLRFQEGAYRVFASRYSEAGFMVKQTSVARVFSSSQANSSSRYIAITVDQPAGGSPEVQLWSTESLSKPFIYESRVNGIGTPDPGFGHEFGFSHYLNNVPAAPKIVKSGFHFWFTQPTPVPDYTFSLNMIRRRTAQVAGF